MPGLLSARRPSMRTGLEQALRRFSMIARLCASAIVGVAWTGGAQASHAPVFLRDVHVDPMLVASGLNTARLRSDVAAILASVQLLRADSLGAIASLDVEVTVPQSLTGQPPEPRALINVEVGRNLMERGANKRLRWGQSVTTPTYSTWRALATATPAAVLTVVRAYVRGASGGT